MNIFLQAKRIPNLVSILGNGSAFRAIQEALAASNLDLLGVHSHIGSQIFEVEGFRDGG